MSGIAGRRHLTSTTTTDNGQPVLEVFANDLGKPVLAEELNGYEHECAAPLFLFWRRGRDVGSQAA